MPRFLFLSMVMVCAGCAGGHRLTQTSPHPVSTSQTAPIIASNQAVEPDSKLTEYQPAPCEGERYDNQLIEEVANQPLLRPLEPKRARVSL